MTPDARFLLKFFVVCIGLLLLCAGAASLIRSCVPEIAA